MRFLKNTQHGVFYKKSEDNRKNLIWQLFTEGIAMYFEQRYFGDWCNYYGFCDVGYYLGIMFIRSLLKIYEFDEIINFDIDFIDHLYCNYLCEVVR